jgi:hypothetical protein
LLFHFCKPTFVAQTKFLKMSNFKIIPLSAAYAARLKTTNQDDFGNELIEQTATGYGPCRVSLRAFVPQQDQRLLASYSPFSIKNAFNQSGPIFLHKEEVEEYQDIYRFPPEIKADKVNFPLTLIGYSDEQRMVFTKLVGENDVDELIFSTFEQHKNIVYLHARNAEAGCFICKIERI